MSDSRLVSGACLCGAVRFEVRTPSLFCGHCHCSMCRRNHGAGFVTWFAVSPERLRIVSGDEDLELYQSSEHGSRSFCRRCGSSLFCRSEKHRDRVDVVLANMEGPIDRLPEIHIWFDDRASWVHVADDLPKLGGKTGLEPVKDET